MTHFEATFHMPAGRTAPHTFSQLLYLCQNNNKKIAEKRELLACLKRMLHLARQLVVNAADMQLQRCLQRCICSRNDHPNNELIWILGTLDNMLECLSASLTALHQQQSCSSPSNFPSRTQSTLSHEVVLLLCTHSSALLQSHSVAFLRYGCIRHGIDIERMSAYILKYSNRAASVRSTYVLTMP